MKKIHGVLGNLPYVKTLLPTFLTISLFIIGLFVVVIPQFENIIIDRKREMIREITNTSVSMIRNWHHLYLDGAMTEQEAKKSAIRQLRSIRYGAELKDYLWVTDLHPTMIVHPYRPDLDGKDLTEFEDSKDKKLFVDMVAVVQKSGEGYVDYMWQWKDDSTKIVPKLSYVKIYDPWNWVVGTGIYIEDVKDEISRLEQKIILLSVLITIFSSLLLTYIAFINLNNEKMRAKAEDELKESREKYRMLVESSGEGLIMILENGQIYYNKTLYSMLGYSDGDHRLALSEIFIHSPQSKIFDFTTNRKKTGVDITSEQIETACKKNSGEHINVLLNLSPISFLNNSGIVINVRDLSTHEEMQEALDYTKEKYLALTNQISIGVFRATPDTDAHIIEANPALANLLGIQSVEHLISTPLFSLFTDVDAISQCKHELFNTGSINNQIVQFRKRNGKVFAGSISAVLVQNNKHEGISIDGIVEDISEQQRSDKEKDNLIADLQTSVIMLSQRISPYIKHVPSCGYTSTIVEAANTMTAEKSASILVRGDNNEPIGIVTDHDIRERIVASGKEMNTPVYSIMTAPVSSISSSASIYDVLVVIREQRHRYLLVNDSNDVVLGIIDADDIFEGSFTNYLFFLRRIDTAVTAGMLAEYHHHLLHMVNGLIRNNADLRSITKFTTLISDAITKRIIQLAIDQVGEPPRRFAFLCMGSEGREEQTLLTDQDNAIVYDDADDEHGASVQQYFLTLGERISDNLNRAGYSYCKGGMMAMNTKWCQPLSVWKKYFTQWVTTANAQDVLEFKIFFDCRFIEGSKDLSDQLNDHIHRLVSSYSNFFVYLSENLLRNELPDGIEKLKTPIDLKIALLPIVDFARLYGLKHRSRSHNTIDRLEFIREREIISDHMFNNILNAYTLLMHTRLLHQTHCHTSNIPIDNIVQPQHLSDMHLLIIKRYFSLLKEIKQKISIDFKGIL